MTKDIWQKLQTFLEEVRSQHHLDIEFVFLKLVHANAFHHVTTVVPVSASGNIGLIVGTAANSKKQNSEKRDSSIEEAWIFVIMA